MPSPGENDFDELRDTLRRAFDGPLTADQTDAVAWLAEQAAWAIRHRRAADALTRSREALHVDLQTQARALRLLAQDRATTRRALSAARAGLWECKLADERLEWSPQVYDLFGFRPGVALHREDTVGCYAPASRLALEAARSAALRSGGEFRLDAEIETARGERRWIRLSGVVERRGEAAIRLYGVKQDVTEERAEVEAARRLAEVDTLTGLANRRLFEQQLAALSAGTGAGLVLIDLDGFKQINDTFGHLTGDDCLKEVGRRLATASRGATLIARIGGDEFAVLHERGLDRMELDRRARRLTEALRIPVARGDFMLELGASAGVAFSDGGAPADWAARADLALYDDKSARRGFVRPVEPAQASELTRLAV